MLTGCVSVLCLPLTYTHTHAFRHRGATWCWLTCGRGLPCFEGGAHVSLSRSPSPPRTQGQMQTFAQCGVQKTKKKSEAGRLAPGAAVPDAGMTPDWFAAAPRPSEQRGSHPAAHARTILGCFVAACSEGRGCAAEFVSGGPPRRSRPGTELRGTEADF